LVTPQAFYSKKILITSAEGFLGSYLTYFLSKLGYQIVITVNNDVWRPLLKEIILKKNIKIFYGSVLTADGRKAIVPYLKDVDTVIHLERFWGGEDINEGLFQEINANLLGTVEFLKLAYKFTNKIIFTSSADIYGKPQLKSFTEEMLPDPFAFYSITKYSIEKYLERIAEYFSKKLIILRISTIYGPYEINNKAVPNFIKAILKKEEPVLNNSKETFRDFIFIEDVCSAIELAIKHVPANHVIFNIASGKAISLGYLINIISEIVGEKDNLADFKMSENMPIKSFINLEKANKILGFYPKFDIYKGLQIEIEWFKEYLKSFEKLI